MNRGIYPILSGALAQEQRTQVFAHNIANVNTKGFKQEEPLFQALLPHRRLTGSPDSHVRLVSGMAPPIFGAAERLLPPQFRAVVRMIEEPILQPIYDLETTHMAIGRVAIIGDAAFVARPHVAAGVAKAADDAAALAAALDRGAIEPALRAFEAERLSVGRRIIERARHLGAYLQATQTIEERARSQRHSIPEAVLAETAVLDFLRT